MMIDPEIPNWIVRMINPESKKASPDTETDIVREHQMGVTMMYNRNSCPRFDIDITSGNTMFLSSPSSLQNQSTISGALKV